MTKKDYVKVADAIKKVFKEDKISSECCEITVGWAYIYLAAMFKKDNPKFDRDKWFKYLED